MKQCKNCNSENLEYVKDYEYQFDKESIELIDCWYCKDCECIHWEDEFKKYWQFNVGTKKEVNNIGNWATNFNKKQLV